jgi:hypothetical protein
MSLNRDKYPLTKDEQAALDLIKSHNALIKVVRDSRLDYETKKRTIDYREIDFYVDQRLDPTAHRPSRSAYFFDDNPPLELRKMDLKSKQIHIHFPGQCRNTHHKDVVFQHTAKTSTSLLPPEPQYMQVFDDDAIGYAWDINTCHLKQEKYVFPENAGTSGCFWFIDYIDPGEEHPSVCSVEALRAANKEAVKCKTTIRWNELVVGLPEGCVNHIFAPIDSYEVRERAWNVMLYEKEKFTLDKNIPVLIIQSQFINDHQDPDDDRPDREGVCRVYTAAERAEDHPFKMKEMLKKQRLLLTKTGFFAKTNVDQSLPALTELQSSTLKGFIGF